MSTVVPLGRHWPGPTLVDLSKVATSLSKHELIVASLRSGVNYGLVTQALLEKRSTQRPDPTREVVLAHDQVSTEIRVPRESVRSYYEKKGLTSLSQQLLLEVLLKQPTLLGPGHYSAFVGTEGDCVEIEVTRQSSNLSTRVERLLPGPFIFHKESWLMQRMIPSVYRS